MAESKIVKTASKAYGYNYASLGDIVEQGNKIPEMRIKPTEFGEFIEYKDDNGEWQIGSKIVVPEMKGMNAAQAYGSALTYARRYTALMALALVCDDDKKLEASAPEKKAPRTDFNEVRNKFKQCTSGEQADAIWNAIPEKFRQYFEKDYKSAKEAF